ncbi:MAG: nucleotidyltransferase domain-containing protein [Candidatus Hatepunaea meridiana]|nr:nucleotidyltransferase domain-containing protein [Candidatus Hatepunaea meridiana]
MPIKIPINKRKLTRFCNKHRIRKLWMFGSVLRDDFRDDSDVDMLYEFQTDYYVGWEIVTIEEELSKLFGRKVDLISEKELSQDIREHPYFQSEIIYDEG